MKKERFHVDRMHAPAPASKEIETREKFEGESQPANSGQLNFRIPRSLHIKLTELAEREGVSLEQYILYKLSL